MGLAIWSIVIPFLQAVGGNIVTGSPISDLNPLFMAAGCTLELESKTEGRPKSCCFNKTDWTCFLYNRLTALSCLDCMFASHSVLSYFMDFNQN